MRVASGPGVFPHRRAHLFVKVLGMVRPTPGGVKAMVEYVEAVAEVLPESSKTSKSIETAAALRGP